MSNAVAPTLANLYIQYVMPVADGLNMVQSAVTITEYADNAAEGVHVLMCYSLHS